MDAANSCAEAREKPSIGSDIIALKVSQQKRIKDALKKRDAKIEKLKNNIECLKKELTCIANLNKEATQKHIAIESALQLRDNIIKLYEVRFGKLNDGKEKPKPQECEVIKKEETIDGLNKELRIYSTTNGRLNAEIIELSKQCDELGCALAHYSSKAEHLEKIISLSERHPPDALSRRCASLERAVETMEKELKDLNLFKCFFEKVRNRYYQAQQRKRSTNTRMITENLENIIIENANECVLDVCKENMQLKTMLRQKDISQRIKKKVQELQKSFCSDESGGYARNDEIIQRPVSSMFPRRKSATNIEVETSSNSVSPKNDELMSKKKSKSCELLPETGQVMDEVKKLWQELNAVKAERWQTALRRQVNTVNFSFRKATQEANQRLILEEALEQTKKALDKAEQKLKLQNGDSSSNADLNPTVECEMSLSEEAFLILKEPSAGRERWTLSLCSSGNGTIKKQVTFFYQSSTANAVYLTASFYNWECALRLTRRLGNIWSVRCVVPQGRHEFKFFEAVNWSVSSDHDACLNEFGDENNYVIVE